MIDEGRRLVGAQLIVTVGGSTVCDEALGDALPGRAMTPRTIQPVYCLTKPLVAAAVCSTAQDHGAALDAPVGDMSPRVASMLGARRVSLRDVLSHSAGLHPVLAADVMLMPGPERDAVAARTVIADDFRVGVDHAYSEFQGWNLLRCWLEDVSGMSLGACVRRLVCEPLGVRDVYLGVSDDEWDDVRQRLGVHYEITQGCARPLLHELLRKHFDDPAMQSIGGYASARGIADFYAGVLCARRDPVPGMPDPATLRAMTRSTAPAAVDPLLTSELSYGLGFMTDLDGALSAALGARTFGHLGPLGHSFAFADPDRDLVAVFCANGFLGVDSDRRRARAALCDAIYEDAAAFAA
ncbi:MAG: serine hydrolase domain-containing protein [Actinomycetota bacterium]